MQMKSNSYKNTGEVIHNRFRKGLKTRDAVGISIALHLLVGMVMAWLFVGAFVIAVPQPEESIEFDLVFENANHNSVDQSDGQKMGKSSLAGKSSKGFAKNPLDKKAILMASLGDLSALKETFSFAMQQITSDSTGFSPMSGKIPSTEFFGAGSENGKGTGRGGISFGVCASPRY